MNDQELEDLLTELAPSETERAALLEEHRQLEKDLLRLADPLPPPDFLGKVMDRVAQAPARPVTAADAWTAAGIVAVTLSVAAVALASSGTGGGHYGLALAALAVRVREASVAGSSALAAVWRTAALPLALGVFALMVTGVAGVRALWAPVVGKAVP